MFLIGPSKKLFSYDTVSLCATSESFIACMPEGFLFFRRHFVEKKRLEEERVKPGTGSTQQQFERYRSHSSSRRKIVKVFLRRFVPSMCSCSRRAWEIVGQARKRVLPICRHQHFAFPNWPSYQVNFLLITTVVPKRLVTCMYNVFI